MDPLRGQCSNGWRYRELSAVHRELCYWDGATKYVWVKEEDDGVIIRSNDFLAGYEIRDEMDYDRIRDCPCEFLERQWFNDNWRQQAETTVLADRL